MRNKTRIRRSWLFASVFAAQLLNTASASDTIQWKGIGPGAGGNIFDTAVSPHNPNVVLTASDVGGIFWSGDGGATWQIANDAVAVPTSGSNYGYGVFAFHPTDPNIVYLGNLKSTDSGKHWQKKVDITYTSPGVTAIDPVNPLNVYAAGLATIYKSTCGWESSCGYTQSCLPNPAGCPSSVSNIRSMVIDRNQPLNLLVCADTGIYKSTDGAVTWTQIQTTGLPHQECNRMVLYQDPGQQGILYLALQTHTNPPEPDGWIPIDPWQGGIYKSTNWGQDWSNASGTDESNALSNPDFETAGSDGNHPAANWNSMGHPTVTRVSTEHHSGSWSIQVQYSLPDQWGSVETDPCVPVVAGKPYKISAWVKASNASGYTAKTYLLYYDSGGSPVLVPGSTYPWFEPFYYSGSANYGWRRFEAVVQPIGATTCAKIGFGPAYGAGTVWIDDVEFKGIQALPHISGYGQSPLFVNYTTVAVDPTNSNTLYAGTLGLDIPWVGEVSGIWKSPNGGASWSHVTRHQYHDNVQDGRRQEPQCGNGVCEGRWENCTTCPADCEPTPVPWCCGNYDLNTNPNGCETSLGENSNNCLVDCPLDPDPNPRPYYEVDSGAYYAIHSIGIGGGSQGHNTVYFGEEHIKSTNGGDTWVEVSSDLHVPTMGDPVNTWQGRGAPNDIFAFAVTTDSRDPNRLYYGDTDGFLKVSFNAGASFATETWQSVPGVAADAPTKIILDPTDVNTLYVAVANSRALLQGDIGQHAVLKAVYNPNPCTGCVGRWTWSPLGTGFPTGAAGVDLLRDPNGNFFAAVYGKGVYRLAQGETVWTNWSNWGTSPPSGWKTYLVARDPASTRLYASAGDPYSPVTPPADETGVWESSDGGINWCKITGTSTEMAQEPPTVLLPYNATTLFVGTWYARKEGCSGLCGGLYRGTRDGPCSWHWDRVIAQPRVSGLAVSPSDSTILYAFVGQVSGVVTVPGQLAGIQKSLDSGNSWNLLSNNGLQNLGSGELSFSASDPHRLYAATLGDGVFEGTITCGPISEGFADSDGDLVPDCDDPNSDISLQVPVNEGSVYSGTFSDLKLSDNVYEVLSEQTSGSPRKLTKVWKFDNVPTGKPYELRVEGFKVAGGLSTVDDFNFSYLTKSAGSSCSNSDTYPPGQTNILTVSKSADDNQLQSASLGTISNPVVCIRVQDSKRTGSDSQTDKLQLDQVVLYALQPCIDADGDGYTASCTSCTNALCPAVDCNDGDDTINPGVSEGPTGSFTCSDGKDNNCNGQPDGLDSGCAAVASADETTNPPNLGSIITGTSYINTQSSDDVREGFQEAISGNTSALYQTWRFDNVPLGSTHMLHYEGYRPNNNDSDNFEFGWATTATGTFSPIGATISSATETLGGTDSPAFGPPNFSGTLYIFIKDTNRSNNKKSLDTVYIDHLGIKTVP